MYDLNKEPIQISTSRTLCVNRNTAQEKFYQVDVGHGEMLLRKGLNNPIRRKIINVNGNVGFKFNGDIYRTEQETVQIQERPNV